MSLQSAFVLYYSTSAKPAKWQRWNQGRKCQGQGQGHDHRDQGQGLEFQGQGRELPASRRLEVKATASIEDSISAKWFNCWSLSSKCVYLLFSLINTYVVETSMQNFTGWIARTDDKNGNEISELEIYSDYNKMQIRESRTTHYQCWRGTDGKISTSKWPVVMEITLSGLRVLRYTLYVSTTALAKSTTTKLTAMWTRISQHLPQCLAITFIDV